MSSLPEVPKVPDGMRGILKHVKEDVEEGMSVANVSLPEVPEVPDGMKGILKDVKEDVEEGMSVAKDVGEGVAKHVGEAVQNLSLPKHLPKAFQNLTMPEGFRLPAVDALEKLQKFSKRVEPEGASVADQNWTLAAIFAVVAAAAGAGHMLEHFCPHLAPSRGRPRTWVVAFTVASYLLLIPGIFAILFSFVMAVQITGPSTPFGAMDFHVTITLDAETHEPGAITESMISVTRMLFKTGNILGGSLVALYAFIIPSVKMVLLVLGEAWRGCRPRGAWVCVRAVQLVSKWACPDLFAYVLVLHLVRALPAHCTLIEARGHLDVGFSCFSIFCICSTMASLWIPLPSVPGDLSAPSPQEDDEQRHGQATSSGADRRLPIDSAEPRMPGMLHLLGRRGVYWLVLCLALASVSLLAAGLLTPCMGLQLRVGSLVQPRGPLPAAALPFLERLDLESQVNSRVSLWDCMRNLLHFALAGQGNSLLALAIFAVFVVGFTAMDLVFLVITTNLLVFRFPTSVKEDACHQCRAWAVAHTLQHVSMLGPAVMGVVVTCLAADNFKKQGVEIFMLPGLLVLLLAELLHYAAYCVTEAAVEGLSRGRGASAELLCISDDGET